VLAEIIARAERMRNRYDTRRFSSASGSRQNSMSFQTAGGRLGCRRVKVQPELERTRKGGGAEEVKRGRELRQEKLGRGGRDVLSIAETFRWNPAGANPAW